MLTLLGEGAGTMLSKLALNTGGGSVSQGYAQSCKSLSKEAGPRAIMEHDELGSVVDRVFMICANWFEERSTRSEGKPDGRQCKLCARKDDDWDPVILAVFQAKCYMLWSRVPDAKGNSTGYYCGYCGKYYLSRIKSTLKIDMKEYERNLAQHGKLEMHRSIVNLIIADMISKGPKYKSARVDYTECESQASLEHASIRQSRVKVPGYNWLPTEDYSKEFPPNLNENGKRAEGHYEYEFEGVQGVLWQGSKMVKFRFEDIEQAKLRTEIDTDGMTAQEKVQSFKNLADSNSGSSNFRRTSLGDALSHTMSLKIDDKGQGEEDKEDRSSKVRRTAFKAAATPTRSPPKASAPMLLSPAAAPITPVQSLPQLRAAPAATPGPAEASTSDTRPKAAPKAKTNNKGRPKKNLQKEFDDMEEQFNQASPNDAYWFGSEIKTCIKDLARKEKDMDQRLKKAIDMDEHTMFVILTKKVVSIRAVLEAISKHSAGSEDFNKSVVLSSSSSGSR